MTIVHGKRSTYINHKCRCSDCTNAASSYSSNWNKNNLDSAHAAQKKWRDANPEKVAEKRKRYRAAHPEKQAEQNRIWKEKNPESYLANKQKYRARKVNANHGCVNGERIKEIIEFQNSSCSYCGSVYEHIDHIIPLSRGGLHCISNLTLACAKCNMSKSSKLVDEWSDDIIDINTLQCTLGD